MTHDLSLHSGERQTALTYDAVRADHRFRYEWADAQIPAGGFGLDVFCGHGYGAWLLSHHRHVLAIDGSGEAIAFARKHFASPQTIYAEAYWPFNLPAKAFDFVVSLESIEHVADGASFFAALAHSLKPGGVLIISTPNEALLPHVGTGNRFHHRHYYLANVGEFADRSGLIFEKWAGQDVYVTSPDLRPTGLLPNEAMRLQDDLPGQFNIAVCRKAVEP